jgi:DNA adenine methylase
MTTRGHEPVLKWAGGKRWLAPILVPSLADELSGTYYEPFVGSAAVFACLKPTKAVLSDINDALVSTLVVIRDAPNELQRHVWRWSNSRDCYERVRGSRPHSAVGRAARFLFLNRTCWGGLYRSNRLGEFNVPFGDSKRVICRREQLRKFSKLLCSADLQTSDFEQQIARAGRGDVVYADPPYTTKGANNGFVRYNEKLFSWDDQVRLANVCKRAAHRGAFVVVSGLWHEALLELYRGWWAASLQRNVCISRSPAARGLTTEAIMFSRLPSMFAQTLSKITARQSAQQAWE